MDVKAKLIRLLETAHREEQIYVGKLTEAERSAVGAADCWSPKDTIGHLAEWKKRMAERLQAGAGGKTPPRFEDIDQENAGIFQQYRSVSWEEVIQVSERAQSGLIQQLQALAEEELLDPDRLSWQPGQPLWRGIAGNGYSHPISHLAQLYIQRGETDYATQIQEETARLVSQLDDSQAWQGVTVYNLACHYALAGQTEKAVANLAEALRLNPELTEWSKQDTDLVSIREDAGYRALYPQ
jgi:tetratricopeptide (TPR) repeat protein